MALRRWLPVLTAALLTACVMQPTYADEVRSPPDPDAVAATGRLVGDAVFGASFKNLHDQMEGLGQYRGKLVIVYFWATWCEPCRMEEVELIKLHEHMRGKEVQLITVALDNGDKVREFVAENKIVFPVFYGGKNAVSLGKVLGNAQGAIPYFAIVDEDGKVVKAFHGDTPIAELERIVGQALQDKVLQGKARQDTALQDTTLQDTALQVKALADKAARDKAVTAKGLY